MNSLLRSCSRAGSRFAVGTSAGRASTNQPVPPSVAVSTRCSSNFNTDAFFEKQKQLNRPLSPHLSIYKPQMTSMLSITHRFTGCGLAAVVYTIAGGALVTKGSFPECIESLKALHLSAVLVVPMKFTLATAFFYHYFNGIRHLAWDLGIGFKLNELYTTGKGVIALAIVSALYATFVL